MPTPEVPEGYEVAPIEPDPEAQKFADALWASLTHAFIEGEDDSVYLQELLSTARNRARSDQIVTLLWGTIFGLIWQAAEDNEVEPTTVIQWVSARMALYLSGVDPDHPSVSG